MAFAFYLRTSRKISVYENRRVVLWNVVLVNQCICYIAVRRTMTFVAAADLRNNISLAGFRFLISIHEYGLFF